ncbi:MAG: RecQ family ATP-dependent DNA helicase [Dehalococcoidia bacterium]
MTSPPAAADLNPQDALQRLFGYAEFRPGQAPIVDAVLAGEDLLAIMPTGAGKSLCYQLPSFLLPGCTVVISPLVALMKDQLDSLPATLRERAAVFNSTIERETLDAQTADLIAGRLKLVYVAPERLRQRPFLHALQRATISRFVIDEAHCISLWGHDFRPDYLFIPDVLDMLGRPPVLAMTATAPPRVQEELQTRLRRPLRIFNTGVLRPNLYLEVQRVDNKEDKLRRLVEICTEERGSGIIYVGSRENAETVAKLLRRERINARHYHAGLDAAERAQVQDAFKRGHVRVITATIAFGMGVDKPDVRFIIHFNPSRSLEAYAQESGRAGRDGRPARCVLFWASSDKAALSRWMREDALTPEVLRAVYRAVRLDVRSGFAWWPLDRLVMASREAINTRSDDVDETTVRVALGALEQVGVLRRYCDLPEAAQIRLAGTGSPAIAELAHALDAAPGNRIARDSFRIADALGCGPSEVEERLLTLEDDGALTYYGTGRGLLIELLPHPEDLAGRLRGLIDGYEQAQKERVEEIDRYATRRTCRTAAIARHFGVPHPGHCDHCDVCCGEPEPDPTAARRAESQPSREPAAPPDRAPEDIIVECIAELPFQMGRTGVAKVLKGSIGAAVQADRSRHFGALAALPASQIEREIDRLVEDGYLHRDDSEYRRLTVTAAGFAKPPAPWPPPRPATRITRASPRGERASTSTPAATTWDDDDPIVEERLAALKEWRRLQLQGTSLPAYTIFNDETLHLLAATQITSLQDLTRIKGIGPTKLEKFGAALLELLGE